MACYIYLCENCGEFEKDFPIGTAPESTSCPWCRTESLRVFTPNEHRMLIRGKGYVDATGKPTGKRHPSDPHPEDYQPIKPYTVGY